MTNLTATQVNEILRVLQTKITNDARARADFLRNPAAALAAAGIALTAERSRSINEFVDRQVKMPGASVAGASINATGAGDQLEIKLVIAIKA